MGRSDVLFFIACVCFSFAHVCRFRPWCLWRHLVSCVAYTCLLRIYALTIVIKTCLPPADRPRAAGVSWRPQPNPLVFLSSHPSFSGSVPRVFGTKGALCSSGRSFGGQWDVIGRCCESNTRHQHKTVINHNVIVHFITKKSVSSPVGNSLEPNKQR